MAQRISRAKHKVRGVPFRRPGPDDHDSRLAAVLQVLYLIFNEGYTATSGSDLHRADLAREAIRLTRAVRGLLPRDGRVTGLLALMLLTEARSAARSGPHGELVPLDEQDRTLWDGAAVAEGTALVEESLSQGPAGAYQLQAAIAALHDEAARPEDTDWPQILALYDLLVRRGPDPMAELGRVVALAMVEGPGAGLAALTALEGLAGGPPPAGCRARPSAGRGRGPGGGALRLPAGCGPHAQRTRGPLSADAGRPAATAARRVGGAPRTVAPSRRSRAPSESSKT